MWAPSPIRTASSSPGRLSLRRRTSTSSTSSALPGSRFAAHALLWAAGLVLYGRALGVGYFADDFALLAALERPGYSLLDPFPAGTGYYFRPLVMLSLAVEGEIFGGRAAAHHAANLALHLLNSSLVFTLCRRFTERTAPALALALLFLAHRANVTNVYWISGRTDSLCAFGYLSALVYLALFARQGRRRYAACFIAAAVLSVFSKETGLTLPLAAALLLSLLPAAPGTEQYRRAAWRMILGLSALMLIIALALALHFHSGRLPLAPWPLAARGLARMGALLFFPASEWHLRALTSPAPAVLIATLVIASAWLLAKKTGRRAWRCVLLPVVPLLPAAAALGGTAARGIYLGTAMACVAGACLLGRCSRGAAALPLGMAALMAASSWLAGSLWKECARIRDACLTSAAAAMRGVSAETTVTLLTLPRQIQEAPILSNDAATALYYAQRGRHGFDPRVIVFAELVAGDRAALSAARGDGFRWRALKADSYFLFPGGPGPDRRRAGGTFRQRGGVVRIDGLNAQGEVIAFQIAPDQSEDTLLLEFDGTAFRSKRAATGTHAGPPLVYNSSAGREPRRNRPRMPPAVDAGTEDQ